MIAREWKCLCPRATREGFLDYLYQTGVRETSDTPGYLGFELFEREVDGESEITLITYWETLEAVEGYAGEEVGFAKLYRKDHEFEIVPEEIVKHYTVLDRKHPGKK